MNIIIPSNKDGPLDLIVEYACDTTENTSFEESYLQLRIRQVVERWQEGHIVLFSQGNLKKVYALFDRFKKKIRELGSSEAVLYRNLNGVTYPFCKPPSESLLKSEKAEKELETTFSDHCEFQEITADIVRYMLSSRLKEGLMSFSELKEVNRLAAQKWNAAAIDLILNLYPKVQKGKHVDEIVDNLFFFPCVENLDRFSDQMCVRVTERMLLTLAKHGADLKGYPIKIVHDHYSLLGTIFYTIGLSDEKKHLLIKWCIENGYYRREEAIRVGMAFHLLSKKNRERGKPAIEMPVLEPFLAAYLQWENLFHCLFFQKDHNKNKEPLIESFREVNQKDPEIAVNLYFFLMEEGNRSTHFDLSIKENEALFCECIALCSRLNLETRGGSHFAALCGPSPLYVDQSKNFKVWDRLSQNMRDAEQQSWKATLDKLLLPD